MNNHRQKILIVEDEFIIAMSLQEKLIAQGYDVPAIASSGELALEYFEQYNPNIVLMDVVLSGTMDGIDVSKQIRKNSTVPIVFCSAYSDEQTLERMKTISISDFIHKPITENDLQIKIKSFLDS